MRNYSNVLILSAVGWLFSHSLFAATITRERSGENNFLFIENNIDNEHFITSETLNPRFSGSNVWTKYQTNQESLGYMGDGSTLSNRYVDLWITNSPINTPFQGLRCRNDGANCPGSGYISADVVDKDGFYHARSGGSIANGNQPYGSFSSSAYNFFREQAVGESTSFVINWCGTRQANGDYDYASGERCKDLPNSNAVWETFTLTSTKVSHLSLVNTNAVSELWIASDGTPSVTNDNLWCNEGIVDGTRGVMCKMVAYNLRQIRNISSLRVAIVVDTALLGFTPSATDVRFSGDGATWHNYRSNYSSTNIRFDDVFTPNGDYIHVFLANTFFQKVLRYSRDITGKDSLFTFFFLNRNTPQSGFYQFTTSNRVNIIPKEYGVSIISSDQIAHPHRTGMIGSDTPINFEYQITTSGPRQANSITAQVIGDSTTIKNIPYCLFSSPENSLVVPIPAYLSFTSKSGRLIRQRNGCSEEPIDITNANWVEAPWDAAADTGFFYKTKLNLLFPMDDYRSQFTVSGDDWLGTVSASGMVKVTATWLGVEQAR